jgi:3'(2'), 5'-bisphosphate nucleotidase
MSDYTQELTIAATAVASASVVCAKVQRELALAGTLSKDDRSPVTVADFASQAVISRALLQHLPGDGLVAEETSGELRKDEQRALLEQVAGYAALSVDDALEGIDHGAFEPAKGASQRYWVLDPIDGTKGFLRGEQYAVALGLIEDGQVVAGVLGCPNYEGGVILLTSKGQGTRVVSLASINGDITGLRVHVSQRSLAEARACESVESGHTKQDASVEVVKRLSIAGQPVRMDSQCKYAAVAMGHAEVYLRLPTRAGYVERVWDHAAGALCVTEAGGTVTDVDGRPLDFGWGRGLDHNRGVIATSGPFHAQVVATVKDVLG